MQTLPDSESRDDALVRDIRDAVGVAHAVPVAAAVAAKACFTWRTIDAELDAVSLCFDSALNGQALVRGPAALAPRTLSFESSAVTLDVEVRPHEISGQFVPAQPGRVQLRGADGVLHTTTADANGWFGFALSLQGPHRFECDSTGWVFITEWTVL